MKSTAEQIRDCLDELTGIAVLQMEADREMCGIAQERELDRLSVLESHYRSQLQTLRERMHEN